MISFRRPEAARLAPLWKEMRRLWKYDPVRRHHMSQLEELRRGLLLDLCQVWVAWDDDPSGRSYLWIRPPHCLGIVATTLIPAEGALRITFAAGRSLTSWMRLAARRLEEFAAQHDCPRLQVFIRKGWLQELPVEWKSRPSITLHRDPELVVIHPSRNCQGMRNRYGSVRRQ